jgi:predicted MFS family arabinose efflux permease
MSHQRLKKYSTLLSLYVAQSIPMSFFSTVVPVIMRQEAYSLESIGYIQLVKLPWIFKFLWAPFIDKQCNSRKDYRQWIIVSEVFYAMIILSISFFDLSMHFTTIMVLMVIAFTASATQDIATDAFAILSLSRDERGVGNSMQSSGSFIGTLMGSGVLLVVYHYLGWQMLLIALALFVTLALIPLYSIKRKAIAQKGAPPSKAVSLGDIKSFFKQKYIGKQVFLLVIFYSGIIAILTMIKPFLVDINFSVMEIGLMSGVYGTAVAVVMAMVVGHLIRRVGRRRMIIIVSVIMMSASMFFYVMSFSNPGVVMLFAGIAMVWGAYGAASVMVYTIAMDVVRPGREGTDFTIQIVITHLSSLIIAVSSGKIADMIGYSGLFAIEAVLSVLVVAATILLYTDKSKQPATELVKST